MMPNESARAVRSVRSYSNACVLCPRKPQQVVYSGIRGRLCARVGLRISARGLAIWASGGCLVRRCRLEMVACCEMT
jgi:hypothetical protein